MRNLTITRNKSFVGCLGKMKVYIEDGACGELYINDIPCRKLGDLKNGEQKTFVIGNESAKVFVIADKLSKNFCNEYYQLPMGEGDIYLSGKNRYNPAAGNAFRFDNNENPDVIANRKRGRNRGLIVLIIAVFVGVLLGNFLADGITSKVKVFSSDGMSIALIEEFTEVETEGYTVTYGSKDVAILALKEEFALAEGFENYTLEQYANLVIENNQLVNTKVTTVDGLTSFKYTFTNPESNETYTYFSYVYKSDDAFWLIQFATLNENVNEYSEQITKWARSVDFTTE